MRARRLRIHIRLICSPDRRSLQEMVHDIGHIVDADLAKTTPDDVALLVLSDLNQWPMVAVCVCEKIDELLIVDLDEAGLGTVLDSTASGLLLLDGAKDVCYRSRNDSCLRIGSLACDQCLKVDIGYRGAHRVTLSTRRLSIGENGDIVALEKAANERSHRIGIHLFLSIVGRNDTIKGETLLLVRRRCR